MDYSKLSILEKALIMSTVQYLTCTVSERAEIGNISIYAVNAIKTNQLEEFTESTFDMLTSIARILDEKPEIHVVVKAMDDLTNYYVNTEEFTIKEAKEKAKKFFEDNNQLVETSLYMKESTKGKNKE